MNIKFNYFMVTLPSNGRTVARWTGPEWTRAAASEKNVFSQKVDQVDVAKWPAFSSSCNVNRCLELFKLSNKNGWRDQQQFEN